MPINEKIAMKFNVLQLDKVIIALICNAYNKKFASNTARLFSLFKQSSYTDDFRKEVRIYIIKKITELILEKNISEKADILSFIDVDGKYSADAQEVLNNIYEEELSEDELKALDELISSQLKYSAIEGSAEEVIDLLNALKTETHENLDRHINLIETSVEKINKEIKSAKESIEDAKKDISLSSGNFISFLDKVITEERNPSSRVQTGIRFLNAMLGGGMQKGRLYIAAGAAKSWKSGFLLNAASWAKRYNSFPERNGLKPVICYLTMENTNEETLTRLWAHCFGNESSLGQYTKMEAANMLERAGIFTPNKPESTELVIWYRSNKSINTADLDGMLEDLEKQGKYCAFLILDYISRIRPVETHKDLRIELSNVTNELKSIALNRDIPILSAAQLNRAAFEAVDQAESFEEKIRALEKLGAANIGESIDVIRNCDFSFIVNKVQKRSINEDGDVNYVDSYLFIKLISCRTKQPEIISFKHRFADGNDMKLIEDINMARAVSTNTEIEFARDRLKNNEQKSRRTIIGNK